MTAATALNTISVSAHALVPGRVIVQDIGIGVMSRTVLREVLEVDRAWRGSTEWIHVRAVEGTARLGLQYPAGFKVKVIKASRWSR